MAENMFFLDSDCEGNELNAPPPPPPPPTPRKKLFVCSCYMLGFLKLFY